MKLKERLEMLKKFCCVNRNFEFEAELSDHLVGRQSIYRLRYIDYHRINESNYAF